MRSNSDFIIHFSKLSLSRVNYNDIDIIRKVINSLRGLTVFLKDREFRLRRNDLILFLRVDFAAGSNENSNELESEFENLEKKKSNSSEEEEFEDNENDDDNV